MQSAGRIRVQASASFGRELDKVRREVCGERDRANSGADQALQRANTDAGAQVVLKVRI